MSKTEQFSILIAALCHDLQHPVRLYTHRVCIDNRQLCLMVPPGSQGVTSTFLLNSRSALAALYDMDPACLEKFHRFEAWHATALHCIVSLL